MHLPTGGTFARISYVLIYMPPKPFCDDLAQSHRNRVAYQSTQMRKSHALISLHE
jgi:hypothetical protein